MLSLASAIVFAAITTSGPPKVHQSTDPSVVVTRENYKGWPGAFRISNGVVDLVVVPQIGRVMRFGYVNGDNLLWENAHLLGSKPDRKAADWQNFGGDKVWVAPQSYWNWPPDKQLDPGVFKVEKIDGGVRMTGAPSTVSHVQVIREIRLQPGLAHVDIENELVNNGETRPISVWDVFQADDPAVVVLATGITAEQPSGWYAFGAGDLESPYDTLHGEELWLQRRTEESRKFGSTTPKGEIKAVIGARTIRVSQRTTFGIPYPDHGSAQEVYLNGGPLKYVELEQLGPLRTIHVGEVALQTVSWDITK